MMVVLKLFLTILIISLKRIILILKTINLKLESLVKSYGMGVEVLFNRLYLNRNALSFQDKQYQT